MTTKTIRYASLVPIAAASVLLLAGCSSNDDEAPTSTSTAMTSMSMPPGTGTGTATAPAVAKEQAEQTAVATVPGGTLVSSQLEQDDGRTVWHVHVRNAQGLDYDVDVDAASGAVVPDDDDRNDEGSPPPATPNAGVTVTKEQAEQTAVATVPGGTVAQSNLEQEDGKTVWHVHIRNAQGWDYDVDVDAASGAVVPD
ncbi:PepSY domain-containing protein [Rhodococcus kronopolitis]|uniref:PepSY domain-containing protein n=1 Tax=Rhodococcus kronopolitis TaxID=1460226 RepID=A0ABV9FRI7_9NOCA